MKGRTTTGRRDDRTRWLRKMLFNLWIKPGLVVFTLICVFIDFVFNFNLLSTLLHYHPTHQAYYTLQRVSSLYDFFYFTKPLVSLTVYPPILTNIFLLFCHFVPINPSWATLSLSFLTSPSVSVPKALTWAMVIESITHLPSIGKETYKEEKESVCSLSSPMIDSDPVWWLCIDSALSETLPSDPAIDSCVHCPKHTTLALTLPVQ